MNQRSIGGGIAVTLSVVIPAYNAERTIGRCIETAWEAGAGEVIVVDDGSSDGTPNVARAHRASVVRQENAGAAQARRLGIARTTGDVIVLLDADDRLRRVGVDRSIEMLKGCSAGLIVGATSAVTPRGSMRRISPWPEGITTESLLRRGSSVGPPASVVWRREVLLRTLEEPPAGVWPRFAEDYELLIRATLHAVVKSHNETVCEYSLVGGKSSMSPLAGNKAAESIRRHYAEIAGISIRQRSTRELYALSKARRAFDSPGWRSAARRIGLYGAAFVIAPELWLRAMRSLYRKAMQLVKR